MKFEIMCVDVTGDVVSNTINQFLHAFLSNGRLFSEWKKEDETLISPNETIKMSIQQYPSIDSNTANTTYLQAYTITVKSENEAELDDFRINLISFIRRKIGFSTIRILRDELSRKYTSKVYPIINELENDVRTFITNFFLKNIGIDWVRVVLDSILQSKISGRFNNEEIFVKSKLIDADVLLLDFDDLGSILYGDLSIFAKAKSTKELLDKIEKSSSLDDLKSDVISGSFSKYFKDCFERQEFEQKWKSLYILRNKVAHNSYFSAQEVKRVEDLCKELSEIIENAYDTLNTFKLSDKDKEVFITGIQIEGSSEITLSVATEAESNLGINDISETNSGDLEVAEEMTQRDMKEVIKKEFEIISSEREFVGLQFFVRTYLVEKGHCYDDALHVVSQLIDEEYFVKKTKPNPYGFYDTSIIEKK